MVDQKDAADAGAENSVADDFVLLDAGAAVVADGAVDDFVPVVAGGRVGQPWRRQPDAETRDARRLPVWLAARVYAGAAG